MKTERKVDEYTCDNPSCRRVVLHDPESGEPLPEGYHGRAQVVAAWGGTGDEWFACRKSCVRGAVLAVLDQEDTDEQTQQSIRRGVAQAEAGQVERMDCLTDEKG